MSTNDTKNAIIFRSENQPQFAVVPEHAIKLFDYVIEETEVDAFKASPDDVWGRVAFWKKEILSRVAPRLRGLVATQYHEYIATLRRNDDGGLFSSPFGFDNVPPYGGEARAQRDAYLACTASLA